MEKNKNTIQLSGCALGVAFGLTWGLGMFLLGLCNIRGDWGGPLLDLLSSIYFGFNGTFKGSVIGLLWGLFDGFIFGVLVALIYNFVVNHCSCRSCKSSCSHNNNSSHHNNHHTK